MQKRGLSTVVISLIIILISLVAVGIIWVVVRNVIQTGTKEVTLGQFTLDAKIKDVNILDSLNNVSLIVKRNPGVGEFSRMNFVFSDGKSSEVITQPVSLNELEEKWFMFHLSTLNVSNLISISIFPYVKQDEKEILGNILDKYTVRGGGSSIILPVCAPATCASLGYECGTNWANGTNCAGTLNCEPPNCTTRYGSGYNCNSSGRCFFGTCSPLINNYCSVQGYECGYWGNNSCSGNLSCGTCGTQATCPSGTCVCNSGWGDCNSDNTCECNLASNSCSGGSCVAIPTGNAYYIDFQNGNDTNNGLSNSSAWKHVPGDTNYVGTGTLAPRDVVYFKKGVSYYGQITTVVDNVTYTVTNWGIGSAIINGSGKNACFEVINNNIVIDGIDKSLVLTGNTIDHAAIWNYNNNYGLSGSVFKNLNITIVGASTSSEGIGIKIGGNSYAYTNYVISNNYISGCYSAGIKISGSGTKYIDIYNNVIENSGDKAGEDTQINLSSNAGEGVQNVTVYNNTIRNGPGNANGLNCNNANNQIYNNNIYGNGGNGISLDMGYNINYNGTTNVYGNFIANQVNYGIIIGGSSISRYAMIYNNLFYNNSNVAEINILGSSSYNQIYFNTIYHNTSGNGIRVQNSSQGNTFKNNIVWLNSGYVIYDSTGNITEDYNCLYRNTGADMVVWKEILYPSLSTYQTQTGQGNHSKWQNCNLTNPQNQNLHLMSNSPAINSGTNVGIYIDYEKTVRPQGSGFDMGAYEYV